VALAFDVIEATIATWLVGGTGLSSAKIVNGNAKNPQSAQPYVTYVVKTPRRVGGPDEVRWSDTSGNPSGAEETATVVGQRELIVTVQCFTQSLLGAADRTGALTAKEYLSKAQTALALPSVRAAMNAAGLVFVDVQNFVDFSEPMGPLGAGRATMDVRIRAVDSVSETATRIDNVQGPNSVPPPNINPTGTFTTN
jgi:hypothetical protein